jgi:hypothetical protein
MRNRFLATPGWVDRRITACTEHGPPPRRIGVDTISAISERRHDELQAMRSGSFRSAPCPPVPVRAEPAQGLRCGVYQRVDAVEPESRLQREARFERKNFLDDHMYSTTGDVYARFRRHGGTSARVADDLCRFLVRAEAGLVSQKRSGCRARRAR